jgi:hypothetical protein
MQPLSQTKITESRAKRPEIVDEHIREHERLIAEHFLENPHLPQSAADKQRIADRERRLRELHELIFMPIPGGARLRRE